MSDEKKPEEPKWKLTDGEASYTFKDNAALFTNVTPLTFKADEYDCPICGVVTSYINITIGDSTLDGMYCQQCYCKWINKNLPRVTKRA